MSENYWHSSLKWDWINFETIGNYFSFRVPSTTEVFAWTSNLHIHSLKHLHALTRIPLLTSSMISPLILWTVQFRVNRLSRSVRVRTDNIFIW